MAAGCGQNPPPPDTNEKKNTKSNKHPKTFGGNIDSKCPTGKITDAFRFWRRPRSSLMRPQVKRKKSPQKKREMNKKMTEATATNTLKPGL